MMYNEELMAPFFCKHYKNVDEIRVLLETDTDDKTENILLSYNNVKIIPCHIKEGLDDTQKVQMINEQLNLIKCDWVYVVDTDEFIFPASWEDPKEFLKRQEGDVIYAWLYQVYRHKDDKDLDYDKSPIPQRLYGDPDRLSTLEAEHTASNNHYVKPIIVRPNLGIQFKPGNHKIENEFKICVERYHGVHWQMADPSLAIPRRLLRKKRFSEENKKNEQGFQHFTVTKNDIVKLCHSHKNDILLPIMDTHIDLHFLKHLAFEINNECQLTNLHKECPRNTRKLIGNPIETKDIIGFLQHCLKRGFDGLVNVHYYNEPLLSKDKLIEIINAVPEAKYSLWTNGINLSLDDESFIKRFTDVMVTIYPETNINVFNILSTTCKNMRSQQGFLDKRIHHIEGKEIERCGRPNWELIIDYCGKGHVCCGDWELEMYIGDIRDGYDMFLKRWDLWRKQLLNHEFPNICKVCFARTPEMSRV